MKSFNDYLERGKRQWGSKFDASGLDRRFIKYYESGQRIKVKAYGQEVTGTVGATTGWKPSFLLIRTARSMGSSYLLNPHSKIIAVQYGNKYVPI